MRKISELVRTDEEGTLFQDDVNEKCVWILSSWFDKDQALFNRVVTAIK